MPCARRSCKTSGWPSLCSRSATSWSRARLASHVICRLDRIEPELRRFSPDMRLAIFRVPQEELSNMRRQADGVTTVCIRLAVSDRGVQLCVEYNGQGIGKPDIAQLVREGYLGLAGMAERARLFGGILEESSREEQGTAARMMLYLNGSQRLLRAAPWSAALRCLHYSID